MGTYCYFNLILFTIMYHPTLYLIINAMKGEGNIIQKEHVKLFFITIFFLKFAFKHVAVQHPHVQAREHCLPAARSTGHAYMLREKQKTKSYSTLFQHILS